VSNDPKRPKGANPAGGYACKHSVPDASWSAPLNIHESLFLQLSLSGLYTERPPSSAVILLQKVTWSGENRA